MSIVEVISYKSSQNTKKMKADVSYEQLGVFEEYGRTVFPI